MARRVRYTIAGISCVATLALALFLYGKWAIRQVQPFYSAALQVDSSALETSSLQMESRVTALVSDAAESETWQAAFSDDEVNGWLATSLAEKFPKLLPNTISDLRVAFSPGLAALGFRYQDANFDSVITIRINAVVNDTDVIAVRLLKAHAGTLPIPMGQVVESITAAAHQQQIAVRWTQQEGDPVALIPISGLLSTPKVERRLNAVEFHNGELYVAGNTRSTPQALAEKDTSTLDR